jgi:hypothetical protein
MAKQAQWPSDDEWAGIEPLLPRLPLVNVDRRAGGSRLATLATFQIVAACSDSDQRFRREAEAITRAPFGAELSTNATVPHRWPAPADTRANARVLSGTDARKVASGRARDLREAAYAERQTTGTGRLGRRP